MLLRSIAGVSLVSSVLVCAGFDTALWLLPVLFAGFYLVLMLIAFLFLVICCHAVDMEKPQEEDSPGPSTSSVIPKRKSDRKPLRGGGSNPLSGEGGGTCS